MENESHILDILRLYEYSMSLGRSLDYYENCDQFLKLLLKRINLNACWVLSNDNGNLIKEYALPFGNTLQDVLEEETSSFLNTITTYILAEVNEALQKISPIPIEKGVLAIFKLQKDNFLFLYSKNEDICAKTLSQLTPVIHKFTLTLNACKAHANQKSLLRRLEERNKELNNYAHIVSHDLKSPLRNIEALATWLKEDHTDDLKEEAIHYIDLISDNIARMEALVSGILEYSTIGLKNYSSSSIDLNILIKDVLQHILIPEHIEISVQENFPSILGDTYRLQQLYQNLINNAIVYNDKQKGHIEIGFQKKNTTYEYFVKDNGIGIEEKYHQKIFSVFQKLENSKNATGIGLSIVEKIVHNYGGKIWLFSELGKGTIFYFTLEAT